MSNDPASVPDFVLRTLLSEPEAKVWNALREQLKGRESRILYACRLSCLVDPDWESGDRKNACYEGMVTFAVVHKNKYSHPMLAVIPRDGPYAGPVKDVLGHYGVPVVVGNIPADVESILREAREKMDRGLAPSQQAKRVTTDGENWLKVHTKDALWLRMPPMSESPGHQIIDDCRRWINRGNQRFEIFQEVALDRAIEFLRDVREVSDEIQKLATFAGQSSFDLLVTTAAPNAYPVLALEFQGPHHLRNPKRRESDAKKARLCEVSRLPLVCVWCSDVPSIVRNTQQAADEIVNKQNTLFYKDLFQFAIRELAEHRLRELAQAEREASLWDEQLRYFGDLEQVERVQAGGGELDAIQQRRLLESSFDAFGDRWDELRGEFAVEAYEEIQDEDRAAFDLKEMIRKNGGRISPIAFDLNESGLRASARLTFPSGGHGETVPIASARVRLTGFASGRVNLAALTRRFLEIWLLETAMEMLTSP